MRLPLILILLLAPSLAGCPGGTAGRAPGNTLRVGWVSDVRTLDPAVAVEGPAWAAVRLTNEGLLDYDDGIGLVPCLARELPSVSTDGRTYTFRLRPGVRFSNGRELVADDCVFTLERVLDPGTQSWGDGFFRGIAGARAFQAARTRDAGRQRGVEPGRRKRLAEPTRVAGLRTLDRYTFEVRLDEPDLALPYKTTTTSAYIVPRDEAERWGSEFYRHPVGTGPFVLKEWRRGARARFARNPLYREPRKKYPDGIDVLIGADELIQQMMFERGELDAVSSIPEPDFIRVTSDPRLRPCIASTPAVATIYLAMNCELPPFTDRRARQAMNYAVDKDRIIRLLNGRGVPAHGVLPPLMPAFNPKLKPYPFDPGRARTLLREAGYPNGFSVEFWGTHASLKVAQAVQQDLSGVGVRMEIREVSLAVFVDSMTRRKTVPIGTGSWWQDFPDPNDFLNILLDGDHIVDEHCTNIAFYSNPEVNRLLHAAERETDRVRRLKLYQQAEKLIVEDAPWIFLYHPIAYQLHQPWLKGFRMHPVWPARYEKWWIDRT